ncbi:MAG TPA: tetratricopeptide repeat protein, partial [Pseudothermotoga sp.]
MEKLVRQHIWQSEDPEIRPSEKFAEEALLKASLYFEDVDQQLSRRRKDLKNKIIDGQGSWEDRVELNVIEQERAMVTVRWLEYGLCVDRDNIWNMWNDLYTRVRRGKKFELVEQMLQVAEKTPIGVKDRRPFIERLTEDQLIEHKLKRVTNQREIGNLNDAKLELETMLRLYATNSSLKATILNQLGVVYRDLGDYEKALKHQEECFKMIMDTEQKNWWAIANVQNQLGFLYRLLEDKNNEALDLAEKHYIAAIDAISKYKESLSGQKQQASVVDAKIHISMLLATIMTNLGYIEGLKKNYQGGYDLLSSSVKMWQDAGREREVARAETTVGILKRDEARFDEALEVMETAIERLHYPDDASQMSVTYFHYGWTQWFKAEELGLDTAEGINLLRAAKQNLEDALDFAYEKELEREKPGILHQLATVTWRLGFRTKNDELMASARSINKQAIDESIRLDNMRYLIDAYTGEGEFDLDILD